MISTGSICRTGFKHWNRLIFYTFLFAAAVRIVFFALLRDYPLLYMQSLDEKYYLELGRKIAQGSFLGGEQAFFMDPFYGYFLGFFFFIFGSNLTTIRLVQILLDSLNTVLIFAIGRRIFDQRAGITAALIYAVYKVSFYYTVTILKVTLAVTSMLVFVLLLLVVMENQRPLRWLLLGILAGILNFIRANFILTLPLTLLFYFLVERPKPGPFLKNSLVFAAGFMAVLSLNGIRSCMVTGAPALLITSSGRVLYCSNNPENTSGTFATPSFSRSHPVKSRKDFHTEAEKRLGRELSIRESSRYWRNETFRVLKNNPSIIPKLLFNKLKWTIANYEVPMNQSYQFAARYTGLNKLPLPNFAFVLALGLPGLVIGALRQRKAAWLFVPVITILATLFIFFVSSRFRMPMVPFLAIGSAIFLISAAQWIYAGSWKKALPFFFIIIPLFIVSMHISPSGGDGYKEAGLAKAFLLDDQPEKAREIASEAVKMYPDNSQLHIVLGFTALSKNNLAEAEKHFLKVLRIKPGSRVAKENLARIYRKLDKPQKGKRKNGSQ